MTFTWVLVMLILIVTAFGAGWLFGTFRSRVKRQNSELATSAAPSPLPLSDAAAAERMQEELARVNSLVAGLQRQAAEQHGGLTQRLDQSMQATWALNDTAESLHRALASPTQRGQWGERMADDVVRQSGLIEGINYCRQVGVSTGGIPDFTFFLPKERLVYMDVKFPADNYLRWLDTDGEVERRRLVKNFRADVRNRVIELADRSYSESEMAVDYVLLFIPNESVFGFVHEHDPDLVEFSLGKKVVLCSPTTLFAVLAIVRQAIDSFAVGERTNEILAGVSGLKAEWSKYADSVKKVSRQFDQVSRAFEDVVGVRSRQFERKLDGLENVDVAMPEDKGSAGGAGRSVWPAEESLNEVG